MLCQIQSIARAVTLQGESPLRPSPPGTFKGKPGDVGASFETALACRIPVIGIWRRPRADLRDEPQYLSDAAHARSRRGREGGRRDHRSAVASHENTGPDPRTARDPSGPLSVSPPIPFAGSGRRSEGGARRLVPENSTSCWHRRGNPPRRRRAAAGAAPAAARSAAPRSALPAPRSFHPQTWFDRCVKRRRANYEKVGRGCR